MKSPFKTPPKKGQTHPNTIAGGFKDVFENCNRKTLGHIDPNLGLECMFLQMDVAIYPRCYRYWSTKLSFLNVFLGVGPFWACSDLIPGSLYV